MSCFSGNTNFCPECGTVLPLPRERDTVTCARCSFILPIRLFAGQEIKSAVVFNPVEQSLMLEEEEGNAELKGPVNMKLRVQLQCKNLHEYLKELSPEILDRLYNHPATCLAVYRGKAWADEGSSLGPDRHARDVDSLDRYAMERWEVILQFMVGSPNAAVSQDLAQLLSQAGLMRSDPGEAPCITSAGFQFLLLDTASQLWYFTLQYLNTAQSRGMELVEILSFLFQLSFSTLGRDYSVEGMSDSLLTFLQHLREFGLVFQRKRKSRRYYPTRLAITLAAGITTAKASSSSNPMDVTGDTSYIVVETNYRIYAYTNSELQIALVALFSEMLYRFPNVVVGQVTRESVQQAIANGITAQQTPVVPATITDQIRLWELERDRLQFTEGVLYNQFLSQADFEVLRDRAQGLGCLVWQNVPHRVMVVSPNGHSEVKKFWKRQKSNP
ncbi:hypothetical protein NHX12_023847 [Muraenolepis orangiensis]|uniref:General transcription factor IIH subunit 4 n=1 Tax=Muraenolepis orangiensis TaxID=630683 RepID=A0A9Q0ISH0_9TELE|nr:hypothetical protein NHX12_023847 [Muraenolepis orangiensis]